MKNVIKRNGKIEQFSEEKLNKSIYRSCLSAKCPIYDSKKITTATVLSVNNWMKSKTEVTTNDIRHTVGEYLINLSHDAGYLYKHNRIMD